MFALPDLPYAPEALEPVMSVDTVQTHYGKHHRKYVETVNQLVDKLDWRASTMEEVVREAARRAETKLFNNAGQAWNHGFYWASMQPGGGRPEGEIVHVEMLTFWTGLDAIRAFAGADVDKAKYYDFDADYLLEMEPSVRHYEAFGDSPAGR